MDDLARDKRSRVSVGMACHVGTKRHGRCWSRWSEPRKEAREELPRPRNVLSRECLRGTI